MKTNRQSFESTIASDSKELIELDNLSLSQVGGGASHSDIRISKSIDAASAK